MHRPIPLLPLILVVPLALLSGYIVFLFLYYHFKERKVRYREIKTSIEYAEELQTGKIV